MTDYRVKANNINIYYEMEGENSNVVFLHGLGDNSQMWWNQTRAFMKDYRYWTPDLRGSGKSDRPKGDYTSELMAQDMYEWFKAVKIQLITDLEGAGHSLIASLSLPPVWIGYAASGQIALHLATTYPGVCRALVLVSCGTAPINPAQRNPDLATLLQKGDMKKAAELMTESAFSPGFKQKNQKAYDQYLKVKQQQKADSVLARLNGMQKSGTPDLSKRTCPVLFIAGQNDPGFNPDMAKQAQAAVPDSKLVVLPTGQASPIEAPDQFNAAVIDFIKTLKPQNVASDVLF